MIIIKESYKVTGLVHANNLTYYIVEDSQNRVMIHDYVQGTLSLQEVQSFVDDRLFKVLDFRGYPKFMYNI